MCEEKIASLLCAEVSSIQNPQDSNDVHVFAHIDELVEVLIGFLRFSCGEPLVEGVGEKVLHAFSAFAEAQLDRKRLPRALEDLSTGFESFLKKIAVVRYETDPVRLRGDGTNYAGLLHTTLGKLLQGTVSKINPRDTSVPPLHAPVVTFSYAGTGMPETIHNRMRGLRNEIHTTPERSLLDLMRLFRIASASYLFATEENLSLIREKVDPLFIYLADVKERFRRWESRYVELTGEERGNSLLEGWPELRAFEWRDEAEDYDEGDIPWEKLEECPDFDPATSRAPIRASVTELADNQHRFWLIGEPGAGKTSTLQMLTWRRVAKLLSCGYLTEPCPVYISAHLFDKSYPFHRIITDLLKVSTEQLDRWLSKGKLWLLIDGLNEIASTEQNYACRELQQLLNTYDDTCIVLSSRKYGFSQRFDIPVFELLPLSNNSILNYLERSLPSAHEAAVFYEQLTGTESLLLDFARNPLMLRMLTQVVRNGQLPSNRGQLLRLFTNWIFSRERKLKQTRIPIKERVLASVGFGLRMSGKTHASRPIVLKWMRNRVRQWHMDVDTDDLFHELLDNHVLELDANDRVTLFHELFLEYFSSLELRRLYAEDKALIRQYWNEVKWFEPVIMLSGLLDEADDLVMSLSESNIRLAARCIASGARVTPPTVSTVIERSKAMLSVAERTKAAKRAKEEAYISLLELATKDALRLVIRRLADEDERFSLVRVLSRCERPEIATLRLLGFGLTGRKRVYQCLSVFKGKPVSYAIINSNEVSQAQEILLDSEVENRDLKLLSEIGISESVKSKTDAVIKEIIRTHSLHSSLWRTAVSFAAIQGSIMDVADTITRRISEIDKPHGGVFYSVFVASTALKDSPMAHEIALDGARRCLELGLYALAIKFIKSFDLRHFIPSEEVLDHIQAMALHGRVQLLLQFSEVYDSINFYPYFDLAVDRLLEDANLNYLHMHHSQLSPILLEKGEALRDVLIRVGSGKMRLRTVRKYIRGFGLEPYFSNIGMIRKYITNRGFGFIRSLLGDEDVFFHFSKVTNLRDVGEPKPRDLVRYVAGDSHKYPGRKAAWRVTILR